MRYFIDYKKSAVNYYIKVKKYAFISKIFGCSRSFRMRWVIKDKMVCILVIKLKKCILSKCIFS